jgi:hypothetical protein
MAPDIRTSRRRDSCQRDRSPKLGLRGESDHNLDLLGRFHGQQTRKRREGGTLENNNSAGVRPCVLFQLARTGVFPINLSSFICLTRKSATFARDMNLQCHSSDRPARGRNRFLVPRSAPSTFVRERCSYQLSRPSPKSGFSTCAAQRNSISSCST